MKSLNAALLIAFCSMGPSSNYGFAEDVTIEPTGIEVLLETDENGERPTGKVLLSDAPFSEHIQKAGTLSVHIEGMHAIPLAVQVRLGAAVFNRAVSGGLQGVATVLGPIGYGAYLQITPVPIGIGNNIYLHGQLVHLNASNDFFVNLAAFGVGYRRKVDDKNYTFFELGATVVKPPHCEFDLANSCGFILPLFGLGFGHFEPIVE